MVNTASGNFFWKTFQNIWACLPDIVVVPDEQQVLEDWQEVGLGARVFHHVGKEVVNLIHVSAEEG